MNRTAFAHACGVHLNSIKNWERAGRLKPHFAHFRNQPPVPYYVEGQIAEFAEAKFWNSGKGMRLAKSLFKQRRSFDS